MAKSWVLQGRCWKFGDNIPTDALTPTHVMFKTANLAGWGTYSAWALLIGFLGAGPFYLMLERDEAAVPKDGAA